MTAASLDAVGDSSGRVAATGAGRRGTAGLRSALAVAVAGGTPGSLSLSGRNAMVCAIQPSHPSHRLSGTAAQTVLECGCQKGAEGRTEREVDRRYGAGRSHRGSPGCRGRSGLRGGTVRAARARPRVASEAGQGGEGSAARSIARACRLDPCRSARGLARL
jgi:hypothetical protein